MDCSCGNRNNYATRRMNNENNCGCSMDRGNSWNRSMDRSNSYSRSTDRGNSCGCSMDKDNMSGRSMDDNGCGCRMMNNTDMDMVVGMAYVPLQKWKKLFDPDKGWNEGTIFPELRYPFYGCIPNGYAGGDKWKGGRCV